MARGALPRGSASGDGCFPRHGWVFQRKGASSRLRKPRRPGHVAQGDAGRLRCGSRVLAIPTRSFLPLSATAAGAPCHHSPHVTRPGWAGRFLAGRGDMVLTRDAH